MASPGALAIDSGSSYYRTLLDLLRSGTVHQQQCQTWMRIMAMIVRQARWFIYPTLFMFLAGGSLLVWLPKDVLHLWINARYSIAADHFFTVWTYLGDGWTAAALTVILLFVRYRIALAMGVSNILCSVVTQVLKHSFFEGALRPVAYFHDIGGLRLVPGIEVYSYNSFPSGHAAVAFASCFILAAYIEHRGIQGALAVIAISIAFSRVYLSQHFFGDVYAGGFIGEFVGLAVVSLLSRVRSPGVLDRSLRTLWNRPSSAQRT